MSKKVTVTKDYIDQLKRDRDRFQKERDELQDDLTKHRNYWTWLYREITVIHGKGNSASAAWLLESMAKQFSKVKTWYWG